MNRREAQGLAEAATPVLQRVMFLFNPPPKMTSEQMRRQSSISLGASLALMACVYAATPTFMRMSGPSSSFLFGVLLLFYGLPFLIVPASLFRLMFGVTDSQDGDSILRGFVAIVLFMLTAFGSCMLFGQLNR